MGSNMGSPGFAAGQGNTSPSGLAARGQVNTTGFASSIRRSSGLSNGNLHNAGRSANGTSILPSSSTNSLVSRGSNNVPSLTSSSSSNSISLTSSGFPASGPSFSWTSVRRSSTFSVRARQGPLGRSPSSHDISPFSVHAGRSASTHDALSRKAYASSIKRSFDILYNYMDLIREKNRADDSEALFFGAGNNANAEWDREAVDGLADFANKFIVQPSKRRKHQALSKKQREL